MVLKTKNDCFAEKRAAQENPLFSSHAAVTIKTCFLPLGSSYSRVAHKI